MPTIRLDAVELEDLKEVINEYIEKTEEEYDDSLREINGNAGRRRLIEDDLRQLRRILVKLQNPVANAAVVRRARAPVPPPAANENVEPLAVANNGPAEEAGNVAGGPNAPANADPRRNNVGGYSGKKSRKSGRKSRKASSKSRKTGK